MPTGGWLASKLFFVYIFNFAIAARKLDELHATILTEKKATGYRVDLIVSPSLATFRGTLSALLVVRWCRNYEGSRFETCDPLAQLWAPTLADDVFFRDIAYGPDLQGPEDLLGAQATRSSRCSSTWHVPHIDSRGSSGQAWAHVTVVNRSTGLPLVSAGVELAGENRTHQSPVRQSKDSCERPHLRFNLGTSNPRHIWVATSFSFEQGSRRQEWPVTLTHNKSIHTNDEEVLVAAGVEEVASGIVKVAVVRGGGVSEGQMRKVASAAVDGIWTARKLRERNRELLRRRMSMVSNTSCGNLKIVLGAGPEEMREASSHITEWIVTDASTLDVVDWEDWEAVLNATSSGKRCRVHRFLAEHVLEHLTLVDALAALSHVAHALGAQTAVDENRGECRAEESNAKLSENNGSSSIRIAVPDIEAGAASFSADLRDHHRLRFDGLAMCELLDSAGLEGYLVEWHHPASFARAFEQIWSSEVIVSNGLAGHTVSRVHPWSKNEISDRGNIARSMRGKDRRGPISLVVDAYVKGSKPRQHRIGDSCAKLMRIACAFSPRPRIREDPENYAVVSTTQIYYKTALESILRETPREQQRQCSSAKEGDCIVLRQCSNHIGAELVGMAERSRDISDSGKLSWAALGAWRASSSVDRAAILSLSSNGSNSPYQSTIEEFKNLCEHLYLKLSYVLEEDLGQLKLALRATMTSLRECVGPLSKRSLHRAATLLDTLEKSLANVSASNIVESPVPAQQFHIGESIPLILNLESFDESHPQHLNMAPQVFSQNLALRSCATVHRSSLENPPMFSTCAHMGRRRHKDSPVSLSGFEAGSYILLVRLWWLPSGNVASILQEVPFTVRAKQNMKEPGALLAPTAGEKPVSDVDPESALALPFHFITIVLNGMPFLRHHAPVFKMAAASCGVSEWKWHLVEGVAIGRANAAKPYSDARLQGVRADGCSVDGTHEFINSLEKDYGSSHIRIHRNNLLRHALSWDEWLELRSKSLEEDDFIDRQTAVNNSALQCVWSDKLRMMNQAVHSIDEECILFQIDSDELWHHIAIINAHRFLSDSMNGHQCLRVPCHFFVGPGLVTITDNGYGHSNLYEWTRVWKYVRGDTFGSHAPPIMLHRNHREGVWQLLGQEGLSEDDELSSTCCVRPETAARKGIGFSHYAYVFESQVAFKANFYGYDNPSSGASSVNLVAAWRAMQNAPRPVRVSNYLPWLSSESRFVNTMADSVNNSPIAPEVEVVPIPPSYFDDTNDITKVCGDHHSTTPWVVLFDMVAFQHQSQGGIARVWRSVLPLLVQRIRTLAKSKQDPSDCPRPVMVVLLFRDGTPRREVDRFELAFEEWGIKLHAHGSNFKDGVVTPNAPVSFVWGPPFDELGDFDGDSLALAALCRSVGANVFISTQYTSPLYLLGDKDGSECTSDHHLIDAQFSSSISSQSPKIVLLLHDMTPEKFQWDEPQWAVKRHSIEKSASMTTAFVSVSQATATAFQQFYGYLNATPLVAYNGLDPEFLTRAQGLVEDSIFSPKSGHTPNSKKVSTLRAFLELGDNRSYIIVVGNRLGYKNILTLYSALELNAEEGIHEGGSVDISLLLVGGGQKPRDSPDEREALQRLQDKTTTTGLVRVSKIVHADTLSDQDLCTAYSGAAALVYISLDEGFGLPIAEALSCGCPVIASDIAVHREIIRCDHDTFGIKNVTGEKTAAEIIITLPSLPCDTWRIPGRSSSLLHPGVAMVDPTAPADVMAAILFFLGRREVSLQATRGKLAAYALERFTSWKPLADALAASAFSLLV